MKDPYDSLVPIFRVDGSRNELTQHGTGILFKLNRKQYLLSAAHVFDGSRQGDLFAPTKDGMAPLDGDLRVLRSSGRTEDDLLDLAVLGLSGAFKAHLKDHFKPLPQTRARLVKSALELGGCSISGYPVSKAINRAGRLSSEIHSFRGVAAELATYQAHSIDPEVNVIIHFDRSRAVHPGTLNPFPTPGLRGVSGGGIFAWPDSEVLSSDWSLPNLVAIFHTYREAQGIAIGTLLLPIVGVTQLMEMQRERA